MSTTFAKQGTGSITISGSGAEVATYRRTSTGPLLLTGSPYNYCVPVTVPGQMETLSGFPLFCELVLNKSHVVNQVFGMFDVNRKPITWALRQYNPGNGLLQADVMVDLQTTTTTFFVYYG